MTEKQGHAKKARRCGLRVRIDHEVWEIHAFVSCRKWSKHAGKHEGTLRW